MKELTPDQLLAAEVNSVYEQFMYFPNRHCSTVCSLWVMHTHLRDANSKFQPYVTPRLYFGSKVAGAGKSLATELTVKMSSNGEMVLEPSAAGITVLLDGHATLGFDEIDTYFGRGTRRENVRALLNGGYKRGAKVPRQRKDEADRQEIHGPVCLNGKNANLFMHHDNFDTLRSRSIAVILEQKPADYFVDRYNPEIYEGRLEELSTRLQRWGQASWRRIESIAIDGLMPNGIANRAEEIWTVLFRIAEFVGGDWPQRVEAAALGFVLGEWGEDVIHGLSPAEELLTCVQATFTDDDEFLPTTTILERLRELPQQASMVEEWARVSERSAIMALARVLTMFGIQSDRRMIDGEQHRGFTRHDVGCEPVPVAVSL